MDNLEVENIINQGIADCEVKVTGDGSKYEAIVISSDFASLNTLKRHQLVYKLLNEQISSGAIHALTIIAKTPEEAEQA